MNPSLPIAAYQMDTETPLDFLGVPSESQAPVPIRKTNFCDKKEQIVRIDNPTRQFKFIVKMGISNSVLKNQANVILQNRTQTAACNDLNK